VKWSFGSSLSATSGDNQPLSPLPSAVKVGALWSSADGEMSSSAIRGMRRKKTLGDVKVAVIGCSGVGKSGKGD